MRNWSQATYDTNGNMSSSIDPLGRTTQAVVSGRGLLLKTTDANGDVTQNQYYADGALQTQTNARAFTQTTTIDARGLTTSQTDWLGNATTSQYDSAANQTSQTDPDNHTVTRQFDADNRPTSTTTPLGEQTQVQYDLAGNVTATIDPTGATTHRYVDLLNRPVLTVDPLGNNRFAVFDPAGNVLAQINPVGAANRTLFDADNAPVLTIDPLGNTGQTQYDADHNLVTTLDGRGMATRYLVNGANEQTAVIDPGGNVSRKVFDPAGQVVQTIDANAHAQTFTFDVAGRQNSSTDADANQAQMVFDPVGNAVKTIDPNGNPSVVTFDGDNRTVATKDPMGNVTREAFDPAGNQLSATDAAGHVTNLAYNGDNERIDVIDPNGHQNNTVFSKRGEVLATYDGNQNGTFSGYSADAQPTGAGQAIGGATNTSFTAAGQQSRLTDPVHGVSRTLYDLDGRTVAQLDPLGHFSYTVYNQDSQPTQQVDADGRTINYTFDPARRLTNQVWLSAAGTQVDAQTFSYDKAGNPTGAGNGYGSYTFVVDPANRVTQQTDPFALSLTVGYDHTGNVTSVAGSTGGTETSVYDADKRLTSRRLSAGPGNAQLRIDGGYTPQGQVSTLTRYADTAGTQLLGKTQDSYDPAGNLTESKATNVANGVLEDFQSTLDPGNRLSSETDTINGTPTTTNYGYDTTSQMTSAGAKTYTFDLNGNRTTTGSQTGADNQLVTDGIWTFHYDPAGNVVEKDGVAGGPDAGITWKYTYDNANHLVVAAQSTAAGLQVQVMNSYDVFGNQVEQDVYTASNGQTNVSKFAQQVVALGNARLPRAWADLNASNQLTTRREYLDAVDAVYARLGQTGTEDWYLADRSGSERGLMNNAGTLDDAVTYDAWGNVAGESNPSAGDRFRFDGQQWDGNVGQYRMGARWLDPTTGRWTSQDPLGLFAGDANLYRFGRNAPTTYVDPTGLFNWKNAAIAGEAGFVGGFVVGSMVNPAGANVVFGLACGAIMFIHAGFYEVDVPPENVAIEAFMTPIAVTMFWETVMADCWDAFVYACYYYSSHPEQMEVLSEEATASVPDAALMAEMGAATEPALAAEIGAAGQGQLAGNTPPTQPPLTAQVPPVIYREGRPSPGNLTARPQDDGNLSFRDSLSNPIEPGVPGSLGGARPVFRPSQDYLGIDTSKLPPGSVIPDGTPGSLTTPPGHVSVINVPYPVLKGAVIPKPPTPPYGPGASGKFPK